jgi:hypothetical protein
MAGKQDIDFTQHALPKTSSFPIFINTNPHSPPFAGHPHFSNLPGEWHRQPASQLGVSALPQAVPFLFDLLKQMAHTYSP